MFQMSLQQRRSRVITMIFQSLFVIATTVSLIQSAAVPKQTCSYTLDNQAELLTPQQERDQTLYHLDRWQSAIQRALSVFKDDGLLLEDTRVYLDNYDFTTVNLPAIPSVDRKLTKHNRTKSLVQDHRDIQVLSIFLKFLLKVAEESGTSPSVIKALHRNKHRACVCLHRVERLIRLNGVKAERNVTSSIIPDDVIVYVNQEESRLWQMVYLTLKNAEKRVGVIQDDYSSL